MRHAIASTAAAVLVLGGLGGPALLASAQPDDAPRAQAGTAGTHRLVGEPWMRTELYFGTAKPDGSVVTDDQFRRFLNEQITPRFPDGLTFLPGQGQFRGSNGRIVRERSMLVILLYPPQARDSNKKIRDIRRAYEHTLRQESVLRVDAVERVSFEP
jgi:hypothetical protein